MKKIFFFILFFIYYSNITNADTTGNFIDGYGVSKDYFEKNYPLKNNEKGFTRFYTEEMKVKNRDLIHFYKNHNNSFEIKQNENGLWGVYDNDINSLVIPFEYKEITQCPHSFRMFFIAKENNSTIKLIDYKNTTIFESKYDELKGTYCGVKSKKDEKEGFITYSGKEIYKPIYDEIECQEHFGESGGYYFIAKKENQYAVSNQNGETIVPLTDMKISKMQDGHFFLTEKDEKIGVIDYKGRMIVPPLYKKINYNRGDFDKEISPYFVACTDDTTCRIVELNGKEILPLKQGYGSNLKKLSNTRFAIGEHQRGMQIINLKGKPVSKKKFGSLYLLAKGYAFYNRLENKGGIGVTNLNGKIIMKPIFEVNNIEQITENQLIKIMKNGKYGIVYKNKMIAEPIFKKIYFTRGHVLLLTFDNKYYVTDYRTFAKKKGNLKYCHKYDKKQYKKVNDKCFKFKIDSSSEILYCNNEKKHILHKFLTKLNKIFDALR